LFFAAQRYFIRYFIQGVAFTDVKG